MKAVIVTPKDRAEMEFIHGLLRKLGIGSRLMTDEEMEDIGLGIMMKEADRSKKVSREAVMNKLRA